MKLRTKSTLLITSGTLAFAAIFSIIAWYALNASLQTDLRSQSLMGAELMRFTLTHEMEQGNPGHIRPYLDHLGSLPGVAHAHLVPADSVIKQFNIDASQYDPASPLERKVLTTGKAVEETITGKNPRMHYAIPYVASRKGLHNCLKCHDASEGDVLGAVSLEIDISEQMAARDKAVASLFLLVLMFGLLLTLVLRRLINPVIATTLDMKRAVSRAEEGDFSTRLEIRSKDEAGYIAEQTNRFMQTLENSFGQITKDVQSLTGKTDNGEQKNLLKKTVRIVQDLVSAAHFKQSIESDRDLPEVYDRLTRILIEQFNLTRFSIYEVSNSKNRMQLVTSHGLPDGADLWCARDILLDCTACRAQRTADDVSSVHEEMICACFAGNAIQDDKAFMHFCLPMMLSGSVGGVLQIIFTKAEAAHVRKVLSTLKRYLAEAAPVIETKRLMQSLREASMHDPMTGLYNRRFLEEYLDTLMSGVDRNKTTLGILMCDVDFFKQVNDTLGHDIGDAMLKTVAEILKQSVRGSDLVIRYGGEEFLAILIDSDEEMTAQIAERVRKTMEEHAFPTPQGPLTKTISIGISFYPEDSEAFWECVKFADVAMYEAKETGRNKVLRFKKEMWKEGENY